MTPLIRSAFLGCLLLAVSAATSIPVQAQAADASMPHLVRKDGRHALIVDGTPFLVLGAQCHNSSVWPSMMPKVWAAIESAQANTLEVPIYWEQFEPEKGRFDTSAVDMLLAQAREHKVRLVLLWFATWKNGSSHYLPMWIKEQPELCAHVVGKDGKRVDSPTPHNPGLLDLDKTAFRALMSHLKKADPQHTVIMVQVENEPGTWNSVRDYSPAAQKLFTAPVPETLLKALGKGDQAGKDWAAVFGRDADEFFHAWSVASYIGEIAAAGKAEYPLPLYINVALRDAMTQPAAGNYESGGATDNVLDIWKAAAPAVDILAPDIYVSESAHYHKVLDLYGRLDNPLFVPETIGSPAGSRYCLSAITRGAIGWSPFGVDGPMRALQAPDQPDPLAINNRVLSPMMRELAQWSLEGRLVSEIEDKDEFKKTIDLGSWKAEVDFGPQTFGFGRSPKGNAEPVGRVLIVKLSPNEFIVTGYLCRVDFKVADAASAAQREYFRVEEGCYENGAFKVARIWNGDETDWGLNFSQAPVVLRVRLGTF